MQFRKYLNLALNIATVAVLLFLGFELVAKIVRGPRQSLAVNTIFTLSGADWKSHPENLVIVLQVGCHWCEASAGMYRDIIRSNADGHIHIAAVLPQDVNESRTYLQGLGINIDEVYKAPLEHLGVNGTPTLLVLDNTGRIKSTWIGQLTPPLEANLFKDLHIPQTQSTDAAAFDSSNLKFGMITADEFKTISSHESAARLIDVNPRDTFRTRHLKGAINMPVEEIETRMTHEFAHNTPIILYCNFKTSCKSDTQGMVLESFCKLSKTPTYCGMAVDYLHKADYKHFVTLGNDLGTLQAEGLQLSPIQTVQAR